MRSSPILAFKVVSFPKICISGLFQACFGQIYLPDFPIIRLETACFSDFLENKPASLGSSAKKAGFARVKC